VLANYTELCAKLNRFGKLKNYLVGYKRLAVGLKEYYPNTD